MLAHERRAHPREPLSLRLRLADGRGARTVNACPTGLYILMPPGSQVDNWVAIEFIVPPGRLCFRVLGEVVRTEPTIRGLGVALRLHGHTMTSLGPNQSPQSN